MPPPANCSLCFGLAFGWFVNRLRRVVAAEDGDVFASGNADADAVEAIIAPLAVHFEASAHLHRVSVRGSPAPNGLLGCWISVGDVIGRPTFEAGLMSAMPAPLAVDDVVEIGG